jgi:hypothetical protein
MAITWVSGSNTTYASRANTTITAPSGIANNDVMIARIVTAASSEAPDPTAPAGWTQIGSTIDGTAGGFNLEARDYIKVASGESGNYTWTHSTASSQGWIGVFRGVDTTTPQDATATANTAFDTTTTTATGLTTATDGAWLIFIGHDWAGNSNNLSPPSGMTERLDVTLTYVATQEIATAGATGNRTHTNNSGGGSTFCSGRLIALRPASAGTTDGAGAFDAAGNLAAAGASTAAGAGSLAGAGNLAAVGAATTASAASFAGAGNLAGVGAASTAAAASFAGSGDLAANGASVFSAAATFTGAGDFAAVASATAEASVTFDAAGDLSAAGEEVGSTVNGSASFAGAGDFVPVGASIAAGPVTFAGAGDLGGVGAAIFAAAASFAGAGNLVSAGEATADGAASFAASGNLAAVGDVAPAGEMVATFEAAGSFEAVGAAIAEASALFEVSGGLSAASDAEPPITEPRRLAGGGTIRRSRAVRARYVGEEPEDEEEKQPVIGPVEFERAKVPAKAPSPEAVETVASALKPKPVAVKPPEKKPEAPKVDIEAMDADFLQFAAKVWANL